MKKLLFALVVLFSSLQVPQAHAIGLIENELLNEAVKQDIIERSLQFVQAKDHLVEHFIKKFTPVNLQAVSFTEFKGWKLIFASGRYELYSSVSPNVSRAARCGFILGRVFELTGQAQADFSAKYTKEYQAQCVVTLAS